MMNTDIQQSGNLYPIRTVSDLTGINPVTLRAWERRYGLFEPVRTDSGHRLYTREHIDLIHRVVGLLDRGMRIGQVRAHLELEQADVEAEQTVADTQWERLVNAMIAAVIQFDEDRLEEAYGEAMASHAVDLVTTRLLVPLLARLGSRWASGEGTVAEEHFFSCYLRSKLGARFHHRTRPRQGPVLLMACLPGDRHEIGLLLFGLAANESGFKVIMLGSDMPLDEIPEVVRKTGADAIVLAGVTSPGNEVLNHGLPRLVDGVDVPVAVGGQASIEAHSKLKKMGAFPLGTRQSGSVEALQKLLMH